MEINRSSFNVHNVSVPPTLDSATIITNGVRRDTEVWLPDGNCIVVSRGIAFRVYQGILSLHSEVFRDLFSLANPSGGDDTMDGCPVVEVTDEPRDIRRLFLVICCGKDYYHEKDEPKPVLFSILSSLIRMGHKYAIPELVDDALSRLKKYYPTSLSAWDDVATRARYVTAHPMDAFEAVRLARLTETPSILPLAFFTCCKNLRSTFAEDGSVERHRFLEKLSIDDAWRLINGRENLARGIAARAASLLIAYASLPSDYRAHHRTCQESVVTSMRALRAGTRDRSFLKNAPYRAAFEPVSDWLCSKPWNPTEWMLNCESCLASLNQCDEETRTRMWSELPRYFDLEVEGWPTSAD